jgi:AcrR family transcriptional regulator
MTRIAQRDNAVPGVDTSTRRRILAATAEVLAKNGHTKLNLSDVAVQAGVSRPTLYRWFASKRELLDAFGRYEREAFDDGISRATVGFRTAFYCRISTVLLRHAFDRC